MRFSNITIFIVFVFFLILFGCTNNGVDSSPAGNDTRIEESIGCKYNKPNCKENYNCIDNKCLLKEGCGYNNPSCEKKYECINNTCILKQGCLYNNPSCGNDYNCINNECVLEHGCQYNNPPCQENYICSNNVCILKTGCSYQNPLCSSDYECINNQCILKKGCTYNNPPCGPGYECKDNICILKTGCQYDNPSCSEDHVCTENMCISKFLKDSTDTEFLIFTSEDYLMPATELAKMRDLEGIKTTIKGVSEFQSGDDIITWLKDYKQKHDQLQYVLLFGDSSRIPTFYSSSPIKTQETVTDFPYTLPKDNLPTLAVGRLPVQNTEEAKNWLTKLKYYESYGGNEVIEFGYSNEYNAYALPHKNRIENIGLQVTALNTSSGEQVANELNLGKKFTIFYGHGSALYFHPIFSIEHLNYLNNKEKPTILFSGGCDTVNYNLQVRSISERLLVEKNGAVAVIGATRNGGYGYLYEFVPTFFEFCYKKRLGDAFVASVKDNYYITINSDNWGLPQSREDWAAYFVERVVLLGDPTTKICN